MTLRCSFMTSSYLSTSLRISALRASTVFWARSMARVTILASMGTSSGRALPITRISLAARPTAKLVVDAAALVALAAEHVQPAQGPDPVALVLALQLVLGSQ